MFKKGGLDNDPIIIPFKGKRHISLTEREIVDILKSIKASSEVWIRDETLKNLILEEGMFWLESDNFPQVQRWVSEILILCEDKK